MKKILLGLILIIGINASADTYRDVIASTPVYDTEIIKRPHTESYQVRVEKRIPCGYEYIKKEKNGLGALTGAVIGGIIGNQIGGGTGKDIATGIGVIAGANIGDSYNSNSYKKVQKYCIEYSYETRYRTTYTNEYVKHQIGYNNWFWYKHKKYKKFSRYKLDKIKIKEKIEF